MKIHLPLPLRAALLTACAVVLLTAFSGAVDFENLEDGVTEAFKLRYGDEQSYDITDDLHIRNNHVVKGDIQGDAPGVLSLNMEYGDTFGCVNFRNSKEFEMTGNTIKDETYYVRSARTLDIGGGIEWEQEHWGVRSIYDICVFDAVGKVTIQDNHGTTKSEEDGGGGNESRGRTHFSQLRKY